jgi:hypothetical protein
MRPSTLRRHDDHRMKTLSIALVVAAVGASVVDTLIGTAAPYPDSLTMTCAQAKAYVAKNDGAILATGNAHASFHSSYCSGQPAYVRTKDERLCFVGQYCDCETTYCAQSYFQSGG